MKMTFKEFLLERDAVETDVEDLSAEDLQKRAMELRRQAQLKASGKADVADKRNARAIRLRMRDEKDTRLKADLSRRAQELDRKAIQGDEQTGVA